MKQILCYGDSNTYGYDPANTRTYSYPVEKRWISVAGKVLGDGYRLLNEGENGRTLPDARYDKEMLEDMVSGLKEGDLCSIMLGTNDLLLRMRPSADMAAKKMRLLLEYLTSDEHPFQVLVIAPVPIGKELDGEGPYHEESLKMSKAFREAAKDCGAHFADAAEWGIDLAFDHVHFSESGHTEFGKHYAELIRGIR